jgi:predicted glycogen debranching enzyme
MLPIRRVRWSSTDAMPRDAARWEIDALLDREWLVTNGRGGYASSSLAGVPTRRFHGLLIAALPAPIGRALMLSELAETVYLPNGSAVRLGGYERYGQTPDLDVSRALREVRLEGGMPVWTFELGDGDLSFVVEKRIHLVYMQNTCVVGYRLIDGPPGGVLRLELRPYMSFRPHEGPVSGPDAAEYEVLSRGDEHEVHGPPPFPPLRLRLAGEPGLLVIEHNSERDVVYRVERRRGYDWLGVTWSPGYFLADLDPARGGEIALVASTETWEEIRALPPDDARRSEMTRSARLVQQALGTRERAEAVDPLVAELVVAADDFIVRPGSRHGDAVKAAAAGDELRSIIAGYHWFTDWGRDTMIALEGLTLCTGRHIEAGYILRTFARYVQDGLIPNMFPEGETSALYHTADATLWFFHALDRYVEATNDRLTLRTMLPTLREIFDAHMRGTRFGIHVDPRDGLLSQGEEGYQLTWMDAKVDGWVVTPRRGKAVEINALFYNALCVLSRWLDEEEGPEAARPVAEAAERVRESFNRRFWYEPSGHLYDVIDGPDGEPDPSLRPNQIFAVSLPHPVLDPSLWSRVVGVVQEELLTPVGLRSLARSHPSYSPRYYGDLRARDAAYHQGTVWSWLIGPFIDAWLRVHPGREREAARFLDGFRPHLEEGCIGSISEIFDAEPPYHPRGCVAQAWGVAEVLRSLVRVHGLHLRLCPTL